MQEKLERIVLLTKEAEHLLITSGLHRRTFEEADEAQKRATIDFLRSARDQASKGELQPSIQEKVEVMVNSYESLPPSEREPAFKCVSSYQACKEEARSVEDKVLCAIALAVCFAKEVVPLA